MIRPLRRRHLVMILGLAATLPPLYLAALASRPQRAIQETLPVQLSDPGPTRGGGFTAELLSEPPLAVRALAAGRAVEIRATGHPADPDLLLYWAPAGATHAPEDALLLGAVRGQGRQRFTLPEAASHGAGSLVLYSLGHGREVARVAWPAAGDSPR